MNSYRLYNNNTKKVDPIKLMHQLRRLKNKVKCEIIDPSTGTLDFNQLPKSETYPIFEDAVCQLQLVDMSLLDNDSSRLAFGINLYNLMIQYAFMKVGIPSNANGRSSFYGKVSFNLGGHLYSFDDLEHGMLRGNKRAPFSLTTPFGDKNDPRRQYVVSKPEYRIHFALNCGANSCPPINYYRPQDIDEELRIVTQAFCEDNDHVEILPDKNEVQLSKLFDWYKSDILDYVAATNDNNNNNKGKSSVALLNLLASKHLRGVKKQQLERMLEKQKNENKGIKITYKTYDWSTASVTNHRSFDSGTLKPNCKSVRALL